MRVGFLTSFGRVALAAVAALAMLAFTAASASARGHAGGSDTQRVIFVGNNWDGTATVIDPHRRFKPVTTLNIIPDIEERMFEIETDPERLAYLLAIRQLIGEGHDQYVDDRYSTPSGRLLIVSRPSLADVVGIRLKTGQIVWRFPMEGQRSDHMGLSPDGKEVAVSDSTANVVHVLDTHTGEELWQFPSGDSPHENTFSKNGKRIFHASIGRVYTPTDDPQGDTSKGEQVFEIVNTKKQKVIKKLDMGKKLANAGYPDMSSAVRPMALSPNENWLYFQVSFFHGFVEYNLKRNRVTRVANMPNLVPNMPREQYVLDSAHHGIAMSGDGETLCVAGTMDDYAAMVDRETFRRKLFFNGEKPYWATTSSNGRWCLLSWSGTDRISVFSYAKRKEIARVPVGDHPQRVRMGAVRTNWLRAQR
jgi:DNA-binding beta-propeller fold protein YncE